LSANDLPYFDIIISFNAAWQVDRGCERADKAGATFAAALEAKQAWSVVRLGGATPYWQLR
jgi:hypothetical protein